MFNQNKNNFLNKWIDEYYVVMTTLWLKRTNETKQYWEYILLQDFKTGLASTLKYKYAMF